MAVLHRVPLLVVHAVENARQRTLTTAQHAVESAAKKLGRYLASVARADRRKRVGELDGRLQAVQLPPRLGAFGMIIRRRQIGQGIGAGGEISLISQVVN